MTNLNNRPVLRSKKVVEKPILKKKESPVVKEVKSFFEPGTDLKGYPEFIDSFTGNNPPWYDKERGITLPVFLECAFNLYQELVEVVSTEVLEVIWGYELLPYYCELSQGNNRMQLRDMNESFTALGEGLKWASAHLVLYLNSLNFHWFVQIQILDTLDPEYDKDIQNEVEVTYHPYSTDVLSLAKPNKKEEFRKAVAKGKIQFGIELEFSHSEYPLAILYGLMKMGIFKFDSSVDGEYVTLPYSYPDMITKIKGLSETFDKLLSANGAVGNGMHVHVSRNALTKEQILNLQWLMNPSTKEGKDYWSLVADRELEGNRWCSFTDIEEWNTVGGGGFYDCERYVILNLTNEHTVEFRMFKSPQTTDKVLWNLSVVAGLVEFSKTSADLDEWMVSPLNPMNQ